ncbi:hypothetical protein B0H10DRAFT_2230341 [Mycena sp. CBHHK59/15]|nr:hypothetical protein B0H10DRAFT_2230341 [Mycena sp. CBHHK59/15]
MVLGVTNLQRAYLELRGLLSYMTIYKPCMEDPDTVSALPDGCVGVYTSDPTVAKQFRIACLPYWFIHPMLAFKHKNILSIATPLYPAAELQLEPAVGYPVITIGATTEDKMPALHLCTYNTPWGDPIHIPSIQVLASSQKRVLVSREAAVITGGSITSEVPRRAVVASGIRHNTRDTKATAASSAKISHEKIAVFEAPEMPPSIPAWERALMGVDQTRPTQLKVHSDTYSIGKEVVFMLLESAGMTELDKMFEFQVKIRMYTSMPMPNPNLVALGIKMGAVDEFIETEVVPLFT